MHSSYRIAVPLTYCGLVAIVLINAAYAAADEPRIDFDRDVAPLLATYCLDCHQGPSPKGGLNLSQHATTIFGGESGPAIVPGDVSASLLWARVASNEMPPKKTLSDDEKRIFERWILAGAKWGADPIDPFRYTTAARAGYDWWSLRPLQRPVVPPSRASASAENPIDQFVAVKLEEAGLQRSSPTDPRTLIRRVYLDLVGLPPTTKEVVEFEQSTDPQAYERLVDRLLASPHYGERWARHWLDVVRYGETDGFERNARRPHAWRYRDWLIRAWNEDMPYDQFCQWQLAGDALVPGNRDSVVATGFLVAGVHNTVLGNDMMRAIARQDELEDSVGNVSQTFLGLTANCSRCHDHKFDPISQRDYYRLASSLSGVQHGELELPVPDIRREIEQLSQQIGEINERLRRLEEPVRKAILAERLPGNTIGSLPPKPLAAWNLRTGLEDQVGKLHLKPMGDVETTAEGAHVSAGAYLRSEPLARDIREKTLEAWLRLDDLNQQGGGVVSLQSTDGQIFDAIVYGERETAEWMAGSNGFTRTQSFHGMAESAANLEPIQFVIVYRGDGTIAGYRNGQSYGEEYKSDGPHTFKGGVVLMGCRHEPPGGNRMLSGTIVHARLYDRALAAGEIQTLYELQGEYVSDRDLASRLTDAQRREYEQWKRDLARLQARRAELEPRSKLPVYAAVSQQPAETHLLIRGDVTSPSAIVSPGGIAAVSPTGSDFGLSADAPETERRRRLAEWITNGSNPLFPRVIANRIWHYHFGVGIVDSPNDFGFNGGRPSHPELLDWLACEFVQSGYQLKALHRLIVTSATYRQASAPVAEFIVKDADSRLLWRKRPWRVEGEVLRDSMLATAGLLNSRIGGESFSDYQIIDAKNGTLYYEPYDPTGAAFQRRSVYRFLPRGGNQGLLDMFDCPDPAASAPRRNATTTPLQALTLWNGEFALRMADRLAERVFAEAPGDPDAQISLVFQHALQRNPHPQELQAARDLVAKYQLRSLCRVLFNTNEFLTVE